APSDPATKRARRSQGGEEVADQRRDQRVIDQEGVVPVRRRDLDVLRGDSGLVHRRANPAQLGARKNQSVSNDTSSASTSAGTARLPGARARAPTMLLVKVAVS